MNVNIGSNCTDDYLIKKELHKGIQLLLLLLVLMYAFLVNTFLAFTTLKDKKRRTTTHASQLAASYISHNVGVVSLITHDIYVIFNGIKPITCRDKMVDAHCVLYFGLSLSFIMLTMNTRFRYVRTVSVKASFIRKTLKHRDVVLKYWIPAVISSLAATLMASVFERYIVPYTQIVAMAISVIPVSISILWNLFTSRFLKKSRKTIKTTKRRHSFILIERASFIVNITIFVHVGFLLVGTLASCLVAIYTHNKILIVAMNWLTRLSYIVVFTIDAHAYLYKTALLKKMVHRRVSRIRDSVFGKQVDDEIMKDAMFISCVPITRVDSLKLIKQRPDSRVRFTI